MRRTEPLASIIRETSMDTSAQPFRVIGRRTPKVDAVDKVTGRAQFGADVPLSRLLVGKIVRSPHAHARIRHIDTAMAAALPGVHAVLCAGDLFDEPAFHGKPHFGRAPRTLR